jgi:hypothetical protein
VKLSFKRIFQNSSWLWWVFALAIAITAIYIAFRSTAEPENISAYSTLAQVIVGISIIFFTARSVILSEKQMQFITNQDLSHTLLANLNKKMDLQLVNLGKYPIYIESITIGSKVQDGFMEIEPSKKVILVGEVITAKMRFTNGENIFSIKTIGEKADEIASNEILFDKDRDLEDMNLPQVVRIEYRYGASGSRIYAKEYDTKIEIHHPYLNSDNRMWQLSLNPSSFGFRTNQWIYSALPIEDA